MPEPPENRELGNNWPFENWPAARLGAFDVTRFLGDISTKTPVRRTCSLHLLFLLFSPICVFFGKWTPAFSQDVFFCVLTMCISASSFLPERIILFRRTGQGFRAISLLGASKGGSFHGHQQIDRLLMWEIQRPRFVSCQEPCEAHPDWSPESCKGHGRKKPGERGGKRGVVWRTLGTVFLADFFSGFLLGACRIDQVFMVGGWGCGSLGSPVRLTSDALCWC